MQRYNRLTRWFHTGTYLVTLVLLFTGWWLWRGEEGNPSFLSRWFELSDVELHRWAGWVLAGIVAVGVTFGIRGALTFVRETLRANRGDGRWFVRWPVGALRGRFAPHRGHFDPGQRVANLLFVGSLGTLIATGIALTQLKGGSTFAWMARTHRYAFYALVPVALGHVLLALGLLPGYRGVWRAMHLRGRVPADTVRRLWPATIEPAPEDGTPLPSSGAGSAESPKPGARV
jgi:cytochrome b subunit of formate dehydrogenase